MSKEKSIHDQIFEFLFNLQITKKQTELRRDRKFGDFGNTLLEIGSQPAIYPVGVALDEIKGIIEKGTAVQMGNNPKLSTGIFTPPTEVKRSISKESDKSKRNRLLSLWASIGGNLDANGDGALLAMMVKKFDITAQEATELGKFYRKIKLEENKQVSDKALWGKDFMPSKMDKEFPDLDIEFLGEEYKQERTKKRDEIIEKGRDIMVSTIERENDKEKPNELEDKKNSSLKNISKEEIKTIVNDKSTTSNEEKLKNLSTYFINNGIKEEKADIFSNHILVDNPQLWDDKKEDYINSSQNALFKTVALEIALKRAEKMNLPTQQIGFEARNIEMDLRKFIDNNRNTYGVKFQRVLLTKRFIESSKYFNEIFLSGDWEKFETKGLGFSQVVKRVEVKDEDGEVVGSYITNGDSVIGKLLGKAYYLHPRNFINGIFNNGELWLKLACGEDGKLNKKSLAYAFYKLTPGRLFKKALNQVASPFNFIASRIRVKILNPFFKKILKFAKGFLRNFLGATGIGGLIASIILKFLGDKFEYYIMQIVQIFLISILGIIFAIFFGLDSVTDISYERIVEDNHKEISLGNTFTDYDWEVDNE